MNRRKTIIYLLLILAAGTTLRFYGITQRGLFIPDETVYYRAALAAKSAIEGYLKHPGGNFLSALLPITDSFAGKPFHVLLGTLSLFIFGLRQYSPIMMTAIFGVLTIWLIFLAGKKLYGEKAGLIAAMLLAVCAFHVYYSRSFMAHADQTFFTTLAAFLYLSGRRTPAGLVLGLAFTLHTVTVFYLPIFVFLEIVKGIFEKPVIFKKILAGISAFLICFFLPPFLFLLISILGRNETAPLFTFLHKGYLGQVAFLDSADAIQNGLMNNRNLGNWHMISLSGFYNGWFFAVLMVMASAAYFLKYVFRKRDFTAFALFLFSAGILIYWQFFAAHERQFRLTLSAYPFFCLIIAVFISGLSDKRISRVLIILLFLEGAWYSARVAAEAKSHFDAVEKLIVDNKADKILTTSYYIATTSDVLMPRLAGPKIICVASREDLTRESRAAERAYLIVSPSEWLATGEFHFKSRPILLVPDQFYFYFPVFYETTLFTGRRDYLNYKDDPFARNIAVFDARDLAAETEGGWKTAR